MSSRHHIEQEIKLTAPDEATLERLIDSVVVRQVALESGQIFTPLRFAATYYDTPDWALRELRWSLRTRFEGKRHVSTLKRNSTIKNGYSSCEEIEQAITTKFKRVACVPAGSIADALRTELPTGTPLLPCVKVTMQRRKRELKMGNTVLELVTDTGIISGNGRQVELHEVELELLQGDLFSGPIVEFTRELINTFSLQPSRTSKHRIGLSLYDSF
jgi:triphosphatase